MAHKTCINKLDKRCDCITDDLMLLEVIEDNIKNLDKLILKFLNDKTILEKDAQQLNDFLKLRLKVINEL